MVRKRAGLRILILAAVVLTVTACQSHVGSGPVKLTTPVSQYVDKLMKKMSTTYIAVSVDGASVGASYCPDGVSAQCRGDGAVIAIRSCERYSLGKKCYLYAHGRAVIWDFDGPALAGSAAYVTGAPVSAKSLEMLWNATGKKLTSDLDWKDTARTEAAFRVDDEETGLRSCAGSIDLKSKINGQNTWLKCDSGQNLRGYVSFKGDELKGAMLDSERRLILLQVN